MKFLFSVGLFLTLAVYCLADETTKPPKLCAVVCPNPLPHDTVYLPSPERCEDFCQCDPRGAVLMTCPIYDKETQERLYFNADKSVCDWPDTSGCVNPPKPTDPTLF